MRYFTYELISAANAWGGQSVAERRKAEARYASAFEKYKEQLESLESRISGDAYAFFRYGFGSEGLHDARLLSLCAGDGLDYLADGQEPFLLNRRRLSVVIELLNYEQNAHYNFDLRKVNRVTCDLFVEDERYAKSAGDLYTYELVGVGDELELGLLFASGATITVQFGRLVFRKKRLKRSYDLGEMYRA
ncbi:MAG TPA: hypothetical protein VFR78_03910 [Pyrinomonadaceae bacterium]|nr:hypothetical protein [Pyrinomonadaceae bacterium]